MSSKKQRSLQNTGDSLDQGRSVAVRQGHVEPGVHRAQNSGGIDK